jgi:hypothetical protein
MKSEHDNWQNRIKFYRDEIKQFNGNLSRVVQQSIKPNLMPHVEHFQNQFIRQSEVLDIIRHDFKQHENLIEDIASEKQKEPIEGILKMHSVQREKLDQFEKIFHELRNEFNVFLNTTEIQHAL